MQKNIRSPWLWIPSLYFAEGLPYVLVMLVSVIMYKRMGISNMEIALYTSWLYLPWVIKPFWSPIVDIFKTKRWWIISTQLFIGAGLGCVALSIPLPNFFKITLGFFWLLAFSSATHDIAADGFYMLGLSKHRQTWFVGIRSAFYKFAMITGQGLLIIFAGHLESITGLNTVDIPVQTFVPVNKISTTKENTNFFSENALPNDLRIISQPEALEIAMVPRSNNYIDSLKTFVKEWNIAQRHLLQEVQTNSTAGKPDIGSWWDEVIVYNIESFLRDNFGVKERNEKVTSSGNAGIVYFRLTKEPDEGEEIIINFGRESGDKSISLLNGDRFAFNRQNWNKPAAAIIQIDPKLKIRTSANFQVRSGNIPLAWSITFVCMALLFVIFFIYHKFILPKPETDQPALVTQSKSIFSEYFQTFLLFFKKEGIGIALAFLLFYRFGEAQLVKLAAPFLLDAQEVDGLALTTGEIGFVYGTVGLIMLMTGGLLGGFVAARHGLKFWIWWMAVAIQLPDIVYVYLAYNLPDNFFIINLCVAFEQFGYGFGFTAYMLFMIYLAEGVHKTAHFAIATGFMALGMMIPGMFSGWLQEIIGYRHFFIWVMIATLPGLIVLKFLKIDPEFGKK